MTPLQRLVKGDQYQQTASMKPSIIGDAETGAIAGAAGYLVARKKFGIHRMISKGIALGTAAGVVHLKNAIHANNIDKTQINYGPIAKLAKRSIHDVLREDDV